jgi:hypothetical protein
MSADNERIEDLPSSNGWLLRCYSGQLHEHNLQRAALMMQVVTREFEDRSQVTMYNPRGGDEASTHVELLGNINFISDFLHAAAGAHDQIDHDVITSDIKEIVDRFPRKLGSRA